MRTRGRRHRAAGGHGTRPGGWAQMSGLVDDDVLGLFTVRGDDPVQIAAAVRERVRGIADRVAPATEATDLAALAPVAAALQLTPAPQPHAHDARRDRAAPPAPAGIRPRRARVGRDRGLRRGDRGLRVGTMASSPILGS